MAADPGHASNLRTELDCLNAREPEDVPDEVLSTGGPIGPAVLKGVARALVGLGPHRKRSHTHPMTPGSSRHREAP